MLLCSLLPIVHSYLVLIQSPLYRQLHINEINSFLAVIQPLQCRTHLGVDLPVYFRDALTKVSLLFQLIWLFRLLIFHLLVGLSLHLTIHLLLLHLF